MKLEIEQLFAINEKIHELNASWNRQILVIASGALALLVGLQKDAGQEGYERYILAAALCFLGTGIIFAAAACYSQVHLAIRVGEAFQKRFYESHDENTDSEPQTLFAVSPNWFFRSAKIVMVISLLGAVVSLVAYSVVRLIG